MGALLSGNRLDFRAVLQSLTNTEIPMPASGRWANAGMVRGGGRDVCWRLLDAQGFTSSLVLGDNAIEIQRGMTTSSTAIFIPFMTKELRMDGAALYYGMNALSNNVIMADRKRLKNPNGLFLGTPGSGKSFAAKREIVNVFLSLPDDDIIIADPEGEVRHEVAQQIA